VQLGLADGVGRGVLIFAVVIALGVVIELFEVVTDVVELVARADPANLGDDRAERVSVGDYASPEVARIGL